MGIILGVEAAVGIAEAAEAAAGAAEAGEAIASASEAGEAISSAAEAGEAASATASEEAATAAEFEGSALQAALETLTKALEKLGKMVVEFVCIDAIFKAAKAILESLFSSDSSARTRAEKLAKLFEVLKESSTLLKNLTDWLKIHSQDTTDLPNFTVTIQGVLSKFIAKLGAAAGVLIRLSKQVDKKNKGKQPITDGEVDAIEHSLKNVLDCFMSLADFKAKHTHQVSSLDGMPIDEEMVASIQAKMP